jgi:hypothetical protein
MRTTWFTLCKLQQWSQLTQIKQRFTVMLLLQTAITDTVISYMHAIIF